MIPPWRPARMAAGELRTPRTLVLIPPSRFMLRGLATGLCVWVTALLGLLYGAPGALWVSHYHAYPETGGLVAIAVYLLIAFVPHRLGRVAHNGMLAVVLGVYGFTSLVQPLGDYGFWHEQARFDHAGASDMLANVLYRLVYLGAGFEGMQFVAPVVGVLFTFFLLVATDELCVRKGDPHSVLTKRFCDMACLAGSWHLMYTRNMVENGQLCVPFLLLAIPSLHRYPSSGTPGRELAIGTGWLAMSAAVHGQAFALFPAVPLIAWLARSQRTASQRLRDVGIAALVAVVVLGLAAGATLLSGFMVYAGNIHTHMFVPLRPHRLSRYGMFDLAHFRTCANILVLASPLVLAAPLFAVPRSLRRRWLSTLTSAPALLILALGYCGFSFVILFMLGFPRDFDLMLGLGIVLHLCVLRVLCRLGGPRLPLCWLAVVVGGCLAWSTTSSLRVPRVGPEERLLINGRVGEVSVRLRERIVIQVRGDGEPFRLVARPHGSQEVVELRTGTAPWTSRALDLRPHGRVLDIEVQWTAAGTTDRSGPVHVKWLHPLETGR